MKNNAEKTPEEKKKTLLNHYTFDEICEILGYFDGSNTDVSNPEMETLEEKNYEQFKDKMLDVAIINGNFEEVITTDTRHAL